MGSDISALLRKMDEASTEEKDEDDGESHDGQRTAVGDEDAAVDTSAIGHSRETVAVSSDPDTIVSTLDARSMDEAFLKGFLDDLLLVLISSRNGACGKTLRSDLFSIGYDVSPGTLYPHLHDLEADGVLTVRKGVKTKQFSVADPTELDRQLEHRIESLVGLAAVFEAVRSDL